jgi:hypothetical protein
MLPDQRVSDIHAESILHSVGGVAAGVENRVAYSRSQEANSTEIADPYE